MWQQRRRLLCTKTPIPKWPPIKQVTKSNFSATLDEIGPHILTSDYVAVSLRATGAYSAAWHRVQPFDTADTAYRKAKHAAEKYGVFQVAVCPFTVRGDSKVVVAYPYNFHLFPRDELKLGMPSYSFSCQSSYLSTMAQEGFDFNVCIYDGISYLSREQESSAKVQLGNQVSSAHVLQPSSSHSVADALFVERIKSRAKHWISVYKDSNKTDDTLASSLRKLMLGGGEYGNRPSLNIDICSERQVQLVVETLRRLSDDVVPVVVPAKGGGTQAVQAVLASSKEDKDIFERELQSKEEEQGKRIRGFREVIDLISTSQKPVVAHNSLNDFTFVHSKFLAPLPDTMDEFRASLTSVFPCILDLNHLMKELGPSNKDTNISTAISYVKRRRLPTIDLEIPHHVEPEEGKIHGRNALRIAQLFAELCSIPNINSKAVKLDNDNLPPTVLEPFGNIFSPDSVCSQKTAKGDISVWKRDTRKVSSQDLVFIWGFRSGMSVQKLKSLLNGSHKVFTEGSFDIRRVDKSCAIVFFWENGLSDCFLNAIDSGVDLGESLREMLAQGLRVSDYQTYQRVCRLNVWDVDLADSLDRVSEDFENISGGLPEKSAEICWNDNLIDLDDL